MRATVPISSMSHPQSIFPNVMNRFGDLFNFSASAATSVATPFPLLTVSPRTSVLAQPLQKPATVSRKDI